MIGPSENLDAAVRDPTDYFGSPMDVVRDPRLTKDEKQRVLESWVLDAQLLSQAEAEAAAAAGGQAGAVRAAEAKVVEASRVR